MNLGLRSYKQSLKADAVADLRGYLVGATSEYGVVAIYTSILSQSRSGNTRSLGVAIVNNGHIRDITGLVKMITGRKFNTKTGGVIVRGRGAHEAVKLVDELQQALLEDGSAAHLVHTWLF